MAKTFLIPSKTSQPFVRNFSLSDENDQSYFLDVFHLHSWVSLVFALEPLSSIWEFQSSLSQYQVFGVHTNWIMWSCILRQDIWYYKILSPRFLLLAMDYFSSVNPPVPVAKELCTKAAGVIIMNLLSLLLALALPLVALRICLTETAVSH